MAATRAGGAAGARTGARTGGAAAGCGGAAFAARTGAAAETGCGATSACGNAAAPDPSESEERTRGGEKAVFSAGTWFDSAAVAGAGAASPNNASIGSTLRRLPPSSLPEAELGGEPCAAAGAAPAMKAARGSVSRGSSPNMASIEDGAAWGMRSAKGSLSRVAGPVDDAFAGARSAKGSKSSGKRADGGALAGAKPADLAGKPAAGGIRSAKGSNPAAVAGVPTAPSGAGATEGVAGGAGAGAGLGVSEDDPACNGDPNRSAKGSSLTDTRALAGAAAGAATSPSRSANGFCAAPAGAKGEGEGDGASACRLAAGSGTGAAGVFAGPTAGATEGGQVAAIASDAAGATGARRRPSLSATGLGVRVDDSIARPRVMSSAEPSPRVSTCSR